MPLLFTENETNNAAPVRSPNASPYVKDAFHNFLIQRRRRRGEPGAHRYQGGVASRHPRSRRRDEGRAAATDCRSAGRVKGCLRRLRRSVRARQARGRRLLRGASRRRRWTRTPTAPTCMRQALAGMLWTKQYFYYDLDRVAGRA